MTRAPIENDSDAPDWLIDVAYLFGKLLAEGVMLGIVLAVALLVLWLLGFYPF